MSQTPPPPPPPGDPQGPPSGYYPPQGQGGSYPPPDQGGHYPPPGQGGYYQQPPKRGSGMAITALVLGIVAILTCWTVVGGILFGLVAVVLGFLASRRAKRGEAGGRGMAIIGILLGLAAAAISVVIVVALGAFWNSDSVKGFRDCVEQAGSDQAAINDCEERFRDDVEGQVNN